MNNKQRSATYFNTLSGFLAKRDLPCLTRDSLYSHYGIRQADMLILFGGSIPYACRVAGQILTSGLAKTLMIVGGEGHTTDHLRRELSFKYPDINPNNKMEADIINHYLSLEFHINPADSIVETSSRNCGENAIFALEILKERQLIPHHAIIIQDSAMQRRMDATLRKVWADERTEFINYAAYISNMTVRGGELSFVDHDIWGLWSINQYIELLMGEIPRLNDDEEGYGPNGKGYIEHVDIPEEVILAYEGLRQEYGAYIRKPWVRTYNSHG